MSAVQFCRRSGKEALAIHRCLSIDEQIQLVGDFIGQRHPLMQNFDFYIGSKHHSSRCRRSMGSLAKLGLGVECRGRNLAHLLHT